VKYQFLAALLAVSLTAMPGYALAGGSEPGDDEVVSQAPVEADKKPRTASLAVTAAAAAAAAAATAVTGKRSEGPPTALVPASVQD